MTARIEQRNGREIADDWERLADLRIEVFREYPYLYEGNRKYERKYLETLAACPRARVLFAFSGDECVGASTVLPLDDAEREVREAFVRAGIATEGVDYFGESVVRRAYRGQGLGVRFFEEREAHARELGLSLCTFCAVDRPADHPSRPPEYVPNDAFWTRRGYRKESKLVASFSWPDLGAQVSSEKTMTFWLKSL